MKNHTRKNTKKWTLLLAGAALLALAVGCGEKSEMETSAVPVTESSAINLEIETESDGAEATEESTVEARTEEGTGSEVETTDEEESSESESAETEGEESESASSEESISEASEGKTVSQIYADVESQVALQSMVQMPDDFITNYYGVDMASLDSYVFAMSEDATSAETVIVMKMKESEKDKVEGLTTALQMVIDEKKAEMQNYLPEQYEIVNKSEVKVSGDYVYLVISENADQITDIIENDIQ
ncbi:MAG: DUF4358 domain-containing protein [bacterium]|nr:DUF4358 domain-containing protein [bacterium]